MAPAVSPLSANAQDGFDAQIRGQGELRSTNASSGPPALHAFGIHQDTPANRENILKKRPVAEGTKVPNDVPPLPGQRISPSASTSR